MLFYPDPKKACAMNVVALLSGGKDSCYSILKVRALGYNVIAVAHVSPPCEEADSFMYQSVGSAAVPLIASALNLPLVTIATEAQAKETMLNYTETAGDEVEDLVTLLSLVKSKYTNVQAVCSGALWSDYQRLRVENAASRVGLLSLAPLWRRTQAELLDEMIDAGVEAVLIKVAAIGLNHVHLGKSLVDMRPTLQKLEALYDCHVCGEGGEYETLVRWMPGFQQRLVFDQTEVVHHTDDPIAPVSFLRFNKISLQPLTEFQKSRYERPENDTESKLPLFRFQAKFYDDDSSKNEPSNQAGIIPSSHSVSNSFVDSVGVSKDFLYITVHSDSVGAEGVRICFERLSICLTERGEGLSGIVFVQLHFASVHGPAYADGNAIYKQVFGRLRGVALPSRACVAFPTGNSGTIIEVLLKRGDRPDVRSLHVQSLSEWAPPCIGPYSQFVEDGGNVFISGVLPLFPPTANVLNGMPAARQMRVCAENLRRTLEASRSEMGLLGFFVLYAVSEAVAIEVEEILTKEFRHHQSIAVTLPVSALPKGALLEIRAVGVLQQDQLYIPNITTADAALLKGMGISFESVICAKFAYLVCSGTSTGDVQTGIEQSLGSASQLFSGRASSHPLAFQIYTTRAVSNGSEIKEWLQGRLPSTSISSFSAPWLPENSVWRSIAKFVL